MRDPHLNLLLGLTLREAYDDCPRGEAPWWAGLAFRGLCLIAFLRFYGGSGGEMVDAVVDAGVAVLAGALGAILRLALGAALLVGLSAPLSVRWETARPPAYVTRLRTRLRGRC